MIKSVSLIGRVREDYLLQMRDVYVPKFANGEYNFIFPGACSLFGGTIDNNETAEHAFKRELDEELPGLTIRRILEHRVYDWGKQLDEVLGRLNDTFHGNVDSFLGFDLNSYVPGCAMGEARSKPLTYREWIYLVTDDNFYVCNIESDQLIGQQIKEGSAYATIPYFIAKSLVIVPTDKLALLDDIARRIGSGEIELK